MKLFQLHVKETICSFFKSQENEKKTYNLTPHCCNRIGVHHLKKTVGRIEIEDLKYFAIKVHSEPSS